jgi:titin
LYSNTATSSISDPGTDIELYKPTRLTARMTSDDYVYLSWQDNSYNESSYHIERRYSDGSWSEIGSTAGNYTSYTDKKIYANRTYFYRIRAYGGGSYSGYSDEVSVEVNGLTPNAPTNLRVTENSDTSVTLRWSDNSSDEFGFKIERRRSGGSYSQIATVGANGNDL